MESLEKKKLNIQTVLCMFPQNICGFAFKLKKWLAFQKQLIFSKSWEVSLFLKINTHVFGNPG